MTEMPTEEAPRAQARRSAPEHPEADGGGEPGPRDDQHPNQKEKDGSRHPRRSICSTTQPEVPSTRPPSQVSM